MDTVLHLILAVTLGAALQDAIADFRAERPRLESRLGAGQTVDLGIRLLTDSSYLNSPTPAWYTPQAWAETIQTISTVDIEAVQHAARDPQPQLPTSSGLHEGFVRSGIDGIWEPVAVYVPARHTEHPPLAIVLHGRPQSETELLGQPYFRELADRTGTVLVAPWGRGSYDFAGAAAKDLDALASYAQQFYKSDPRALYLVGYSMGGFSVFKVGTDRPWSAVMCIAGALLNSEVPAVRFAWHDTPVYVVNGSADEAIPPEYGLRSAAFMLSLGIPTAFYQEPGGHHAVRTLMPVLERAWADMHAGIVRSGTVPSAATGTAFLPSAPSMHDADLKP